MFLSWTNSLYTARKPKPISIRDKVVTSPSYMRAAPFMLHHGVGSEIWDIDVAITEAESEGLD